MKAGWLQVGTARWSGVGRGRRIKEAGGSIPGGGLAAQRSICGSTWGMVNDLIRPDCEVPVVL